jgi:hypothetical protein
MSEEKDKPAEAAPATHEPAKEADAEQPKLTRAELMATLRLDPHFRVLPPSGEGFIMPWPGPIPPKKTEG